VISRECNPSFSLHLSLSFSSPVKLLPESLTPGFGIKVSLQVGHFLLLPAQMAAKAAQNKRHGHHNTNLKAQVLEFDLKAHF
jgi:hypothetical protein